MVAPMYQEEVLVVGLAAGVAAVGQVAAAGPVVGVDLEALVAEAVGVAVPAVVGKKVLKL